MNDDLFENGVSAKTVFKVAFENNQNLTAANLAIIGLLVLWQHLGLDQDGGFRLFCSPFTFKLQLVSCRHHLVLVCFYQCSFWVLKSKGKFVQNALLIKMTQVDSSS